MPKSKIAVTIDAKIVNQVDRLVKEQAYPNRSRVIEDALLEKLARIDRTRLARELKKIDPAFEQSLAEEGLSRDQAEWPVY